MTRQYALRGIETSTGEAGYCNACQKHMPQGPDICLGVLPNVSHACCGHGGACIPYVVIGGLPDQRLGDIKYYRCLRDDEALEWMRANGANPISGYLESSLDSNT